MNIRKIAALAAAAVMAAGIVPMGAETPFSPAITAEAADDDGYVVVAITLGPTDRYVTDDGFVICENAEGVKFLGGYKGNKKSVTVPKEVTAIGNYAFEDSGVEHVKIHAGITEIAYEAFSECVMLKTVTFEKGSRLTEIGGIAFSACENLEKIDLTPCKNLKSIGRAAFSGCNSLKTIDLSACTKLNDIGEWAFHNCFELNSVILPDSVTTVGDHAFINCAKLEVLTVPPKAKVGEEFAGYFECLESDGYKSYKADGEMKIYLPYDDEKIELLQEPITLYVTEGSDGERYAKENGIAYKYGAAPVPAAAPANLKATAAGHSVMLTWDKASGADFYRVYKYNEKTKRYEKYADVSGTKCTVTGLKAGREYNFKVISYSKADGKNVQGGSSSITVSAGK